MATQSLMRRLPPVSVMISGLVLVIMLVLVVFAPLIAPMDPRGPDGAPLPLPHHRRL